MKFPGVKSSSENEDTIFRTPVLVIPNSTQYNQRVPMIVGTNVLQRLRKSLSQNYGERYLQVANICSALNSELWSWTNREKRDVKRNGKVANLKLAYPATLKPGESKVITCNIFWDSPALSGQNLIIEGDGICTNQPKTKFDVSGLEVLPSTIKINKMNVSQTSIEICNMSKFARNLEPGVLLAKLSTVRIVDHNARIQSAQANSKCESEFQEFLDKIGTLDKQNAPAELITLLRENQDIFSKNKDDIGVTSYVEHEIKLTDSHPFKDKPRRVPPHLYQEVRQHINDMLNQGVIQKSNSPWCSNIVLARKSDNSLRFCVD